MDIYIDFFIKMLCYFGYTTGLTLFLSPILSPVIRNRLYMRKIRNSNSMTQKVKKHGLITHIQLIIYVLYGTRSIAPLIRFFLLTLGGFAFTAILLTLRSSFGIMTMIISSVVGLFPYFYLRVRLRTIRIEGSYEAEGLITELINQYKINYFNMVEAIDKCIPYLDNYPYSKKALLRLALTAKDYSTEEELDAAINEFVYAIDTEWSAMLGMNIYLAIVNGSNVTESLEDIIQELKTLKKVLEQEKKDNNESFVLIKYFSFIVLAFTVICEVMVFRIPLNKVVQFQFYTPVGVKLSAAIIVCMVVNFGMLYLLRKPKYDL